MNGFFRGLTLASSLTLASLARSVELIVNGGFENGLAGWTSTARLAADGGYDPNDPSGSARAYVAQGTGGVAPLSGLGVLDPPEGAAYALADATGAGATALIQNLVVPRGLAALTLSYRMFVYDNYGYGPQGTGLAYSGDPGSAQLARVDLLVATAADFSTDSADVVRTFFAGAPSDPDATFDLSTFDLTDLAPGAYRLRFATVDNGFVVGQGIDAVSLSATSSVPGPAALVSSAAWALSLLRRRARRA